MLNVGKVSTRLKFSTEANLTKSFVQGHFMCLIYDPRCSNYLIILKKLEDFFYM